MAMGLEGVDYFSNDDKAPSRVTVSWALLELFKSMEPILRLVRGATIFTVMCIFGDYALEAGFGASWSDMESQFQTLVCKLECGVK